MLASGAGFGGTGAGGKAGGNPKAWRYPEERQSLKRKLGFECQQPSRHPKAIEPDRGIRLGSWS